MSARHVTESHNLLSGDLSRTPLFAILRRIQRARMTGTLQLWRNGQQRWLSFERGELQAARSSKEEHRIGQSLVLWGYLSEHDLQRALAGQKTQDARLDQILVERGLVSRGVVDLEARRLMEQIVSSALSWPDGSFEFELRRQSTDEDIAFSLSVTEMIIEGIRRIPESQKFLELLGDLSRIPAPVEGVGCATASTRLPVEAGFLLSRMDGRTDVRSLLSLAPSSRLEAAKILYTLVYCGFVDLQAAATPAQAPAEVEPETANASVVGLESGNPHRSLLRSTYRRIDWLSHYDLLGVRTDATPAEIDAAHRRLAPLFDPSLRERADLVDCGRELTVVSHRLQAAHEALSNPDTRAEYDKTIQRAQAHLDEGSSDPNEKHRVRRSSEKVRRWTASRNYQRAQELIEQKDFYPAIQMLEEAVQFAPENASYRLLLGRAKMQNRWWRDEGLAQLEEAARLDPTSADVQGALAEAYLEQGAYEKSLASARTALNVAPLEDKDPYRDLEKRVEEAAQIAAGSKTLLGRVLRSA